jgi:8-oxo-dGTP pyrophosphatase MutT (NUDIX family)
MNMPKTPQTEEDAINVAAPPGFDAQAIPIHEICSDQIKVPKEHFEPASLKARFQAPPNWQPEITDENRHVIASDIISKRQAAGRVTKAAVLIPLVLKEEGLSVLLTQRTNHLRDHAGQISFPGGRMDPEDLSPNDTALRESEEEIGLDRKRVEIIGHLPQYLTVSGYSVTPVVGLVQAQAEYVLDEFEVADVQLAALAIGGIVGWAPVWFRQNGRLSLEEVASHLASLALGMVRSPAQRGSHAS